MSLNKETANRADDEALHPIQVVERRTAVNAHLIRAWERRYGAVVPKRTATNRRLYTDDDIQRLRLLNQAIGLGRRIGDVARLSGPELKALITEDQQALQQAPAALRGQQPAADDGQREAVEACIQAIENLDSVAFDAALASAAVKFSPPVLLDDIIQHIMRTVGQRWHDGSLRLCHEHMATAVIRSFLGTMAMEAAGTEANDYAPVILTTTPDGQRHELGALMVALVAAARGWQPLYLGPSTPVDEIVFAATNKTAKAVALSIGYPTDDPHLPAILKKLRRRLPKDIPLLVGGAAAGGYQQTLEAIEAICPADLSALQTALDELRGR